MKRFLWQLYDQQGRPVITEGVPKLQAAIEGRLHGSAHVWIWRRQNGQLQVLLQKRSVSKINWPGWLDKSAGGHILYGERPLEAALRKIHTELGLTLDSDRLKFVGVNHWLAAIDGVSLVENDLQWVYIAEVPDPTLKLPTHEVETVVWRDIADISPDKQSAESDIVPYGKTYFMMLREAFKLPAE